MQFIESREELRTLYKSLGDGAVRKQMAGRGLSEDDVVTDGFVCSRALST